MTQVPATFNIIYPLVIEMRRHLIASVDVAGCHTTRDSKSSVDDQNFQLLCSVILSSQTKDIVIGHVMARLHLALKPFSAMTMLSTADDVILIAINGVSFHIRKLDYLKRSAKMIVEQYENKVPDTMKELSKLPGIGPKTGALYLNHTANNLAQSISSIPVDTHLHRIFNRWHLVT